MAAYSTKILFTAFLAVNFLQIKAEQTRLEEFRAGLESENEISDLDDQLKKLSTAQDAEEDDSFGTVVIGYLRPNFSSVVEF